LSLQIFTLACEMRQDQRYELLGDLLWTAIGPESHFYTYSLVSRECRSSSFIYLFLATKFCLTYTTLWNTTWQVCIWCLDAFKLFWRLWIFVSLIGAVWDLTILENLLIDVYDFRDGDIIVDDECVDLNIGWRLN
jgi:hypothetical protein